MRQSVTLEVAVLGLGEAGGAIASASPRQAGRARLGRVVSGGTRGVASGRASAFRTGSSRRTALPGGRRRRPRPQPHDGGARGRRRRASRRRSPRDSSTPTSTRRRPAHARGCGGDRRDGRVVRGRGAPQARAREGRPHAGARVGRRRRAVRRAGAPARDAGRGRRPRAGRRGRAEAPPQRVHEGPRRLGAGEPRGAKARGAERVAARRDRRGDRGPLLERLLSGSATHAERRLDEMEAAAAYLDELGVEPRVSRAAAAWLEAQMSDVSRASRSSRKRAGVGLKSDA